MTILLREVLDLEDVLLISGEIFDIFGSYLPTMWICIVAMVIGGILVAFEPMAKKIDDKRHNINGSTTEITEETE